MTIQSQIAIREEVSPEQFDQNIEAAQHKARSLKHIVDSQGLSVRIGASEHLKVEAWLTIAAGYGYSPRIAWSRPLPGGGYEAHAELVDSLGTVVGAGEAECGTEGDDSWLEKPAFQQRSMAQTRATVRACRNKLAWVVILAGYSPTPAEEMVKESTAAPKGNRYWCAEHKTVWFKKGKMPNYAHPIGDTKQWCNMKDNRDQFHEPTARDIREQDMAINADGSEAQQAPAAPADASGFATLGDLYTWAQTRGYPTIKSRMDVPGVAEAIEAHDYPKAATLLEAAKKGK